MTKKKIKKKIELDKPHFEKLTRIKDEKCLGTYAETIESLIESYSEQKENGQKNGE